MRNNLPRLFGREAEHPFIRRLALYLLLPAALLSGLYALAGFVLLPALAERKLAGLVQEKTGAKLTLDALRFNPFRFILEADGVRLLDAAGRPLFSLEKLHVDASLTDSIAARRPLIRKIRLGAPQVHWQRLADGASNFSRLLASVGGAGPESASPQIGRLLLEKGALEFVDEARHQAIRLRELEFDARNLLAGAGTAAPFTFKAASGEGETLDVSGTLQLEPWVLSGEGRLDKVRLPFWWSYFGGVRGLDLESGALALDAPFSWTAGEKPAWSLGPGRLRLGGIKLNDAAHTPLLEAAELSAEALTVDGAARRVDAGRLTAQGLVAQGWRTAEGFHLLPALAGKSASQDAGSSPPPKSAWSYRVAATEFTDSRVIFEDRALPSAVRVELSGLQIKTGALDSDGGAPVVLELSGIVNQGGRLALRGEVMPHPLAARLKIEAGNIALPPFQPWLERWMRLELEEGALHLAGELDYRQAGGAPRGRFNGELGVAGLRAVEADDERELLAWKELSLKGVDLAFPSGGLRVAEVEAERPYARVIVNAGKSLNWSGIFTDGSAARSGKKEPAAFPVDIGVIRVREGLADFTDLTLKPDFATSIHGLNGAVRDLSSSPSARARVLLEGQVERYSPVRIQGLLNPFRADAYSDIEMKFQNLDLTRLSPYSGKFAGYRIEKGKMSLNLHYLLQDRLLDAQNRIVLNNLTLGERVPSKDATNLPLRLAVALLKDAGGNIDIDLPVRGNLDDPEFSLGALYGKAIVQLVTKLAASPFTVFGNLLQGSPEEYGRIVFKPGKAILAKAQKDKLSKLAAALKTREDINLEIKGVVHAGQDRTMLAELKLDKAIRQAWRVEQRVLGKNPSKSSKLVVPEDDAKRILTQLFRAASGENGAPPGPHPDEAFLAYARRVVVDKTAIDEADLRLLAQKRGEAVRNFLVQSAGLPEQRIFLLDVGVDSQPDQEAKTQLMLNGS